MFSFPAIDDLSAEHAPVLAGRPACFCNSIRTAFRTNDGNLSHGLDCFVV